MTIRTELDRLLASVSALIDALVQALIRVALSIGRSSPGAPRMIRWLFA
jgi:hypothetical protein